MVEPLAELIGFIDIGSLSDDLLLELLVCPCSGMRWYAERSSASTGPLRSVQRVLKPARQKRTSPFFRMATLPVR